MERKLYENIVGKGVNAGNQQFLLFPTMFSIQGGGVIPFHPYCICRLHFLSALISLYLFFCGKGVNSFRNDDIEYGRALFSPKKWHPCNKIHRRVIFCSLLPKYRN